MVGGGVLGAATALWLARAGAKPLLLEREALAAGASGRNGGLVVPGMAEAYPDAIARHGHDVAKAVWSLTVGGLDLLDTLLAEEQIDCDHRMVGHLNLAIDEAQYAKQRTVVAQLQADGFAAELLDRVQAQALVRTPLAPHILGGKWLPQGRALHSARFVHSMAAAARRHGATICTGIHVQTVGPVRKEIHVFTNQGIVSANSAVVALNAWTGKLLPRLGGLLPPVRGQVLSYEPVPPVFPVPLGASITPTGEYWQQTPDGTIVIGGCRAMARRQDILETSVATTPEVQAGIEGVLPALFPELGPLRVARRWGGTMAFSPDNLPLVGSFGKPPFWFVGGFSGHGMPFALPLGRLLAQAALSGTAPPELAPFAATRLPNY